MSLEFLKPAPQVTVACVYLPHCRTKFAAAGFANGGDVPMESCLVGVS